MPVESDDPRDVDVLVVHADDVVAALAATAQGRETVLRVTPPFRPRQRARIHVPTGQDGDSKADDEPAPLAVSPTAFVDEDAPSFPRAPDTEPVDPEEPEYDVEEHLERHEDAVAEWRETVPAHFRDDVTAARADGDTVEFEVRYLGR